VGLGHRRGVAGMFALVLLAGFGPRCGAVAAVRRGGDRSRPRARAGRGYAAHSSRRPAAAAEAAGLGLAAPFAGPRGPR